MTGIRSFKVRDLSEVVRIENECFDPPWPYSTFLMLAIRGGVMRDNEGELQMVVYENNEEIVGYIVWEYDRTLREGHLLNIAVAQKFQRQGIGSHLASYFLDRLKKLKATRCYLEVREGNLTARRFYEILGFCSIDRSPNYYETEDAIIYEIQF